MSKNVVITGASKGIGYELSLCFLKQNHNVFGTNTKGIHTTIENNNLETFKLDLSKNDEIEKLKNHFDTKNLKIDVLINNAGIGPDLDALKPDLDSFKNTFDVNVTGTTFLTESLLPLMNNEGKIINITSKMGSINYCNQIDSVAYRMSKTALNMYTKILTNRHHGKLSIASVHPGWVQTSISENSAKNGRLLASDSAKRIFDFIMSDFKTGIFWDVEFQKEIEW